MRYRIPGCLVIAVVLIATGLTSSASAAEDLSIPIAMPSDAEVGRYTGSTRIALGEVKDEGFAEADDFLGMGPQGSYSVLVEGGRVGSVRKAAAGVLETAGLAAGPDDAATVMNVVIRRDRFQTHQTGGRFRLRTEVFLEFDFVRDGTSRGRVLACGNAETYAQAATKAKITATYQSGFNDAFHKLVASRTFARLVGEGWTPGSPPEAVGDYKTSRLHKDEFYGPTDVAQAAVAAARKTFEGKGPYRTVVIEDFRPTPEKKKDISDDELAATYLSEAIREHLEAFFPGAFETIERVPAGRGGAGLVVGGDVVHFRVGSYLKRIFIGFGAGKDKLEAKVVYKDGASGEVLHKEHVLSSNWGAAWLFKQGQVRDMADQLARDVAYVLVKVAVPDYAPPADLEVLFDDTPYPMLQRKS